MLNLIKYEFRKTMISKLILLAVTGFGEIVFLLGLFLKWEKGWVTGTILLTLCAIFGCMYIGIESMLVFHKDLNTKQSYMLFLTPNSSYQILGAKILENGISLALTGLAFVGLAFLDATVAILYLGGLKEFLDIAKLFLKQVQIEISVSPEYVIVWVLLVLASWLLTITLADLSIVLSASVLAGKRFSGAVSFILFMVLSVVSGKIMDMIPSMESDILYFTLMFVVVFLQVGLLYFVTGWIMEKKLSV